MKPRWIAFAIFLVAVMILCGVRCILKGSVSSPEWVAAVDLPINTRISTNHLRKPVSAAPAHSWGLPKTDTLVGKYTKSHIPNGGEVVQGDLGLFPHVAEQQGTTLVSLRAPDLSGLAPYVNAGAKVYVFAPETTNIYGPYKIEAVLANLDSPTLLIRASNSEAGDLLKLAKPELRLAGLPGFRFRHRKP